MRGRACSENIHSKGIVEAKFERHFDVLATFILRCRNILCHMISRRDSALSNRFDNHFTFGTLQMKTNSFTYVIKSADCQTDTLKPSALWIAISLWLRVKKKRFRAKYWRPNTWFFSASIVCWAKISSMRNSNLSQVGRCKIKFQVLVLHLRFRHFSFVCVCACVCVCVN